MEEACLSKLDMFLKLYRLCLFSVTVRRMKKYPTYRLSLWGITNALIISERYELRESTSCRNVLDFLNPQITN